jgi:hypothetical protein
MKSFPTVSPVDGIDTRGHGRRPHPPGVLLATKLIDRILNFYRLVLRQRSWVGWLFNMGLDYLFF